MKPTIQVVSDKDNPSHLTVRLEGELVLNYIGPIKSELEKVMQQATAMHIEISNLPKVDVAGIQLLLATRHSLRARQIDFRFAVDLHEDTNLLLAQAGIDSLATLLNYPTE